MSFLLYRIINHNTHRTPSKVPVRVSFPTEVPIFDSCIGRGGAYRVGIVGLELCVLR